MTDRQAKIKGVILARRWVHAKKAGDRVATNKLVKQLKFAYWGSLWCMAAIHSSFTPLVAAKGRRFVIGDLWLFLKTASIEAIILLVFCWWWKRP